MNGRKILVRGNHDIFKDEDYREVGFQQIHGVRVFVDKFILSHIPLHPDCVSERFRVNVHGHLHANEVMRTRTNMVHGYMTGLVTEPDPQYLCVCVEQTDFTPLHFDEVEERIQQRWKDSEYTGPVKAWGNGSGPN
jgi:calcineurin-like phosphoesterase family protein